MPKSIAPLSSTQVRQAKPKSSEYSLADGKGLYLRVKPHGTKLWLFNYQKPYTKNRTNISIGIFPTVTLAQARSTRENYNSMLSDNIDPKEHRITEEQKRAEAHSNTFENVYTKWMKLKEPEISETYYKKIKGRLEKYIIPKIGKTPIHKVNAVDTIAAISPVADDKKLETVKKLCGWINEIMVYAVNTGVTFANPLTGIGKAFNSPKPTHLPTLKPNELPELMSAIDTASIKLVTKCLIEWQLHTMVRPGEAAGTLWEEIDQDKALWDIPAKRMKQKRRHVIPLSPQAIKILKTLKPVSGHRKHVFPSNNSPRNHANTQTANMAIKRMGFKGRLVAHGLRGLASTTLNEEGLESELIEFALAHVDTNSVRDAYNHAEYIERRRKLMCWWSDHIEAAQPSVETE
ncbi:MAG: tyrosine-type recombinase/integrase [Proteobacteria bacterium]|jgi:integrase|nr:tyrosine-type recombinase/integrase [Pseudomonadota bacterium]